MLTELTGVTTDEVFSTRVTARVGALTLPFIGRLALLDNKRATARPKDLADVLELEKMALETPAR